VGEAFLDSIDPSPLHTMNRAVAVAEWQGVDAGLALLPALAPPAWLAGPNRWDAVLGDLPWRTRYPEIEERHRERALASTEAVREILRRKLAIPG
jgi:predicted RNA polymerase sigma factor